MDILEPCGKLIVEARRRLLRNHGCALSSLKGLKGVRNLYPYSLQDFEFCTKKNRTLGLEESARDVDTTLREWQKKQHTKESDATVKSVESGDTKGSSNQSPTDSSDPSTSTTNPPPESESSEKNSALKYDCIWNQWVLLYLTDEDLISYLQRCKTALTDSDTGFIFCKENVMPPPKTPSELETERYKRGFEVDAEDNGLTRSDERYRMLFEKAGFDIVCAMKQANWPEGLYPVYMYVLKPKKSSSS